MNDKDIERAAIKEILNEAKLTEDKNKSSDNGLCINKRLLSRNLVSTLRHPVFSREFRKRKIIGLDNETESDYELGVNHAKWKRSGDHRHLTDDDYIYDARDYFNPEKYREIVAYRHRIQQKHKSKTSKKRRSAKGAHTHRRRCHDHNSKYGDNPQENESYSCKDDLVGENVPQDSLMNTSKKKKHRKDKERVKRKKRRKKSKHKDWDKSNCVDRKTDEHKKHAKHKKHRSDEKKKSNKRSKKSKKSRSSLPSNDEQLAISESASYSNYYFNPLKSSDYCYDSKDSSSDSYHGNKESETRRGFERIGDDRNSDVEYVDRTEISYENYSSNSQGYSDNGTYLHECSNLSSHSSDQNYCLYNNECGYNDGFNTDLSDMSSFEDEKEYFDANREQLEWDSDVDCRHSSEAENVGEYSRYSDDE